MSRATSGRAELNSQLSFPGEKTSGSGLAGATTPTIQNRLTPSLPQEQGQRSVSERRVVPAAQVGEQIAARGSASQVGGARGQQVTPGPDPKSSGGGGRKPSAGEQASEGLPLFQVVGQLWAAHQGWPAGKWPGDRRFDAIQIARWCKRGWPMEFWMQVIESTPVGCAFTYLTTPPEPGKVARLEEAYIRWREGHYATVKKDDHWSKIGDIIRQHFGPGNPEGGF